MCNTCITKEEYNIGDCFNCGSWICLRCNFFIPDKMIKMKNVDDNVHLDKVFKKHSKMCIRKTEQEKDIEFERKYCNGCKSLNRDLIDKIAEYEMSDSE
jgi:predicted ATP-dependent serine protease